MIGVSVSLFDRDKALLHIPAQVTGFPAFFGQVLSDCHACLVEREGLLADAACLAGVAGAKDSDCLGEVEGAGATLALDFRQGNDRRLLRLDLSRDGLGRLGGGNGFTNNREREGSAFGLAGGGGLDCLGAARLGSNSGGGRDPSGKFVHKSRLVSLFLKVDLRYVHHSIIIRTNSNKKL